MRDVVLLKRKAGLDEAAFLRAWHGQGRPPVAAGPAFRAHAGRYVQNHVAGPGPRGDAFPFDGLSEIERVDGAGSAPVRLPGYSDPEAAGYIDQDASLVFQVTEKTIMPRRGGAKILILSRRNQQLTHEEYVRYWSTTHVEVVSAQPDFYAFYRGYTQFYIAENSFRTLSGKVPGDTQPYDGLIELWFDSVEAARAAFATEGYRTAVRADEPNFLTMGTSLAFAAEEHVIF